VEAHLGIATFRVSVSALIQELDYLVNCLEKFRSDFSGVLVSGLVDPLDGLLQTRCHRNSGERSFFGSPSFSDVALFGHLNRP
jgi:hypothetical protein